MMIMTIKILTKLSYKKTPQNTISFITGEYCQTKI